MRHILWLFFAIVISIVAPASSRSQPLVTAAEPVQFSSRIETGNRRDANGRRYQDHSVRLEAGQRYRVSVMAARFDTMVQVLAPGATQAIAENDDSPTNQNARATFEAPQSGVYLLRALSFLPEATGSYYLRIERALPFPPPLATERPAETTTDTTAWLDYSGSLTRDDPSLDGLNFDDYLVNLEAGESVLIELVAQDFDPFIQVFAAADREDGLLAYDDDSGGNRNAFLRFAPDRPGDYVVRVIAWGTTLTRPFLGNYRLRIGR